MTSVMDNVMDIVKNYSLEKIDSLLKGWKTYSDSIKQVQEKATLKEELGSEAARAYTYIILLEKAKQLKGSRESTI